MGIIITIVLGALIGWIASMIMRTDEQQGAIANIIIGILGAFVGGFIFRTFFDTETDSIVGEIVVGVIGAVIVIAVWKAITGHKVS